MIRVIEAISFSMETINSFPESLGPWPHTALAKHELPQVPCCKFITPSWKGNADTRMYSPEYSPANNVTHRDGSLTMQEAWEAFWGDMSCLTHLDGALLHQCVPAHLQQ